MCSVPDILFIFLPLEESFTMEGMKIMKKWRDLIDRGVLVEKDSLLVFQEETIFEFN